MMCPNCKADPHDANGDTCVCIKEYTLTLSHDELWILSMSVPLRIKHIEEAISAIDGGYNRFLKREYWEVELKRAEELMEKLNRL
jgi:hypothetical protein